MGYICHHAVIVTSWDDEKLAKAHDEVRAIGRGLDEGMEALVSPIVPGTMNGQASFFIAPDGSIAGWHHSDVGDEFREAAIRTLRSYAYGDGSTSVQWCEVQFGDDNDDNRLLRDDSSSEQATPSTGGSDG